MAVNFSFSNIHRHLDNIKGSKLNVMYYVFASFTKMFFYNQLVKLDMNQYF